MAKAQLQQLTVNRDWCKGCGICVRFCPKKVLELEVMEKATPIRPEQCICCRLCELLCPDLAIEIVATQEERGEDDEHR